MIYIEVIGGLGNQMFQYAMYYKLALTKGKENVNLHTGAFSNVRDNNGYELDNVFAISNGQDYSSKSNYLLDDKRDLLSRVRRKIFGFREGYIIEGDDLSFKNHILHLDEKENIYLRGLWQSEKYFKDIRNSIINEFRFPDIEDENNKVLLKKINSRNAISIHIRRGDYVSNTKYYKILGDVCGIDYYNKAIIEIEKYISNPSYFIFSDDISWVKQNIQLLNSREVEYVNWNTSHQSYIDMQLMSKCRHNIIANSTFSWWGAWLNDNEDKIVISPATWFKTKKTNRDIIPEDWIRI